MIGIITPHFDEDDFGANSGYVFVYRPPNRNETYTPKEARRFCLDMGMRHRYAINSWEGGLTPSLREVEMQPWAAFSPAWWRANKVWPRPHNRFTCFYFTDQTEMYRFLVQWRLGKNFS